MTSPYTEARDKEAENNARELMLSFETDLDAADILSFNKGADFGAKYVLESEEIKGIREVMRRLKGAMWCENIDEQNETYERAAAALAAFDELVRQVKGEE